jgi:hypothetical protein
MLPTRGANATNESSGAPTRGEVVLRTRGVADALVRGADVAGESGGAASKGWRCCKRGAMMLPARMTVSPKRAMVQQTQATVLSARPARVSVCVFSGFFFGCIDRMDDLLIVPDDGGPGDPLGALNNILFQI